MFTQSFTREIFGKKYSPIDQALKKEFNNTRKIDKTKHLCHAPFKSLRFTLSGKATVCCFNRQHTLGTYPQDSIREIWFGKKAEELRNNMKKDDLNLGCQYCKHMLENKEFESVKSKMYDHLPVNNHGFPVQIEFELDNTCNLECVMCNGDNSSSIRKNREKRKPYSSPYGKNFINEIQEFLPYLHQSSFIGGEPFLIPLYFDIWEKIIELNPQSTINVTTNATILNDKVKSILEQGFFEFSVSLESLKFERFEEIRKNADLNVVLHNLDWINEYCKRKGTSICVWICPIKRNWDEIPQMIKYFGDRGIPVHLHTVWFPPEHAIWNLSTSKLHEIVKYYNEIQLPTISETEKKNNDRFKELIKQVHTWHLSSLQKTRDSSASIEREVQIFKDKLENYLKNNNFNEFEDVQKKLKNYLEKVEFWEASLKNRNSDARLHINSYPIDKIVGELELWDKETIVNRFNQLIEY